MTSDQKSTFLIIVTSDQIQHFCNITKDCQDTLAIAVFMAPSGSPIYKITVTKISSNTEKNDCKFHINIESSKHSAKAVNNMANKIRHRIKNRRKYS